MLGRQGPGWPGGQAPHFPETLPSCLGPSSDFLTPPPPHPRPAQSSVSELGPHWSPINP